MPLLEVIAGPDLGREFDLESEDQVIIGRDASCTFRLEDGRTSRQHSEVRKKGKVYMLRDIGSSNGTILNGKEVANWTVLEDGDDFKIGQTTIRFVKVSQKIPSLSEDETIVQSMDSGSMEIFKGEHSDALRFLLDLARVADETDNAEDLAKVLSEELTSTMTADRVFLFVGKDENMTRIVWDAPKHLRNIYMQPYSTSVVAQITEKHVAVLSSPKEDDRFKDALSVAAGDITSAICVPLLSGDELLGALYLDRMGQASNFTASDLELATAAGLQCAMALLNIRRITELRASRDRLEVELSGSDGIIGDSKNMRDVFDFVSRAAPTDAGVLVLGESGTGKELIARAIHKNSSRVERPFVIVNCAALAESLAEAELFGHERGAFTGADKSRPGRFLAADGGSIFLDEIGELSEPIQAKLLRVLESGEISPVGEAGVRNVDVRVIAATNRDLAAEVESGRFRRDLYYRLNILAVNLPPVRERGTDVTMLLEHFANFFVKRCGRQGLKLSEEVKTRCQSYPWPGNVREMRNAVERMVILARGEELSINDLPPEISGEFTIRAEGATGGGLRPLADIEREHILGVLEQLDGNKKKAAEVLKIDRSTLYAKLKGYDIE